MRQITSEEFNKVFNNHRSDLIHLYQMREILNGNLYVLKDGAYALVLSSAHRYDGLMSLVIADNTFGPEKTIQLPPANYELVIQ